MSGWEAQRAQLRPAPIYPREFTCIELDMFCAPGSKGPMALKKVRKEKRENHSTRALLDDNPRKLKERPSWLSISRQPSSSLAPSGSWRQVTCNLLDDAGQAILRLYTEDQCMQHYIQVHALFAPNIRIVDPTLLMRRFVLAIYGCTSPNTPSTSASPPTPQDPIYLAFRDRDTLYTWLVLLRSFARPDLRPHTPSSYSPPHPAPYRVWRQLQIAVIAGRKLPDGPQLEKAALDDCPREKEGEEGKEFDIFLEAMVNGITVGRTGPKPIPGTAWQPERIVVTDPDLGGGSWAGSSGVEADSSGISTVVGWGIPGSLDINSSLLEIRIWRAKPAMFGPPAVHIASIPIDLGPFRRGEAVKGWWPGYPVGGHGRQDGEVMLEIKFDEEIVMPLNMYHKIKEILARRNYFELWQDLTERVPLPAAVSVRLISLAQHHATLAPHLCALACAEIEDMRASPSTLFRGNTILTRVAEAAMSFLGARGFLENSIGGVVRRMYREKVVFGVGSAGGSGSGVAMTTEGADTMAYWLQEMWNSIWRARGDCPEELRQLFFHVRTRIDARWGNSAAHVDLKYQCISAFLFLRFFIPALLRPDQNGLAVGPPPEGVERSLKSMARALQSLANLNTAVQREEFMRSIKTFNEDNVDAMIDYLIFVSTPSERLLSVPTAHPNVHHQHHLPPRESAIHTALRARLPAMPALQRESLPTLPHLVDEARDLAAIASAVVRNIRMPKESRMDLKRGMEGEGYQEGDVGPMGETLQEEPGDGPIGKDPCSGPPCTGAESDAGARSETKLDVLRFIKACFDIEAEAMRRIASQGAAKKKNPRRRRRHKLNDRSTRIEEEKISVDASAGTTSPSIEAQLLEGKEASNLPSPLTTPISMADSAYGSLLDTAGDPGEGPETIRRTSHIPLSKTPMSDLSGHKKRKGVFRFMPGSRK